MKTLQQSDLKQINGGSLLNLKDGISKYELAYLISNILGPPVSTVYLLGYVVGKLEKE
jgi:hypothetical protein